MGCTVGELLARIDSRELTEWEAYECVAGPIGPERADIHAAIIASTIANANRPKGKQPIPPEKFIPTWDDPRRWEPAEQSDEGMLRAVKAMNRAMGGTTRTRGVDGGDAARPHDQGRARP